MSQTKTLRKWPFSVALDRQLPGCPYIAILQYRRPQTYYTHTTLLCELVVLPGRTYNYTTDFTNSFLHVPLFPMVRKHHLQLH